MVLPHSHTRGGRILHVAGGGLCGDGLTPGPGGAALWVSGSPSGLRRSTVSLPAPVGSAATRSPARYGRPNECSPAVSIRWHSPRYSCLTTPSGDHWERCTVADRLPDCPHRVRTGEEFRRIQMAVRAIPARAGQFSQPRCFTPADSAARRTRIPKRVNFQIEVPAVSQVSR
jgi:hypothetical protein